MTTVDISRRLSPRILNADVDSFHGLNTVVGFMPSRPEAAAKNIQTAYNRMLEKQRLENEQLAITKNATDAARAAEIEFHGAVLAMKGSVRGQFGPNSNEAQAVGYKKTSAYKRPRRRTA